MDITVSGIIDALIAALIAAGAFMIIAYFVYMVGLIFVLKRLHRLSWMAFVPVVNYYAQVRSINAPKHWFWGALVPVVGAVYAGSTAIRMGAIFGRGPAFSLVWLTIGAPIGMFVIALGKAPVNQDLLNGTPRLLDVKAIKRDAKRHKTVDDLPGLDDIAGR